MTKDIAQASDVRSEKGLRREEENSIVLFMPRSKTASFVCELPLRTSPAEAHTLFARFEVARQLYNACLSEALRRLSLLRQSVLYHEARALAKTDPTRKTAFEIAHLALDFTETGIEAYVTTLRNSDDGERSWLGDHMDSHTAQKLAARAFAAVEKVLFGKAKKVRFKGKNQLSSVEGKSNAAGIRFREDRIEWSGLILYFTRDERDLVIAHSLNSRVKYVRLVRRELKGNARFYAQLVCEGVPCQKPGKPVPRRGVVGIDLGPSTLAAVGKSKAILVQFCAALDLQEKELRGRWHSCECGVSAQRDLYSAYLAQFVEGVSLEAKQARACYKGAEALLETAFKEAVERAKEGKIPQSFGAPRLSQSSSSSTGRAGYSPRLTRN